MDIEEYRIRPNSFTAMHGSFVASHCISDSLIFLSLGIGCKAQLPSHMGSHETGNNYVSRMGWAELDGGDLIRGSTEKIRRNILGQIDRGIANFFPIVISPVVKTIGMEDLIKKTAADLERETGKHIRLVELSGAESDFWEGYNNIIVTFLKTLDWKKKVERKTVNIFGYPFDRYGKEHSANVKELRMMLAKIGVKVQAIFLSGSSTAELAEAQKAEFNIMMPHASTMVREIEKITRKESIMTDIPLGLENTKKWMQQVATALKRGKRQASEYIRTEEEHSKEKIRSLKKKNDGKTAGLVLDLPHIGSMISMLNDIGIKIGFIAVRDRHFGGKEMLHKILKYTNIDPKDVRTLVSPTLENLMTAARECNTDIVIGSAAEVDFVERATGSKKFIFGFPSYGKHYWESFPFLGYNGGLNLAEEITDTLEGRMR